MGKSSADTKNSADTRIVQYRPGTRVYVVAGMLKGMSGTVIELRPSGKALVRICGAVYIELHQYWLKPRD